MCRFEQELPVLNAVTSLPLDLLPQPVGDLVVIEAAASIDVPHDERISPQLPSGAQVIVLPRRDDEPRAFEAPRGIRFLSTVR